MDRNMNRSTSAPYLPRYQSPSPARSPYLGGRRFTSLRNIPQPSQRIYYIDSSPVRVINSYHVHHSPSPNRTYKVHLSSSKINHYLTRVTRSQSAYDINSSHVYTSSENISYKPLQEAATRRAESCEDIYHKASFFPDITPSESGVSFGESEEGSAFGGEDDNVSQNSFDSSSAFYEVTMDNELDKGDSDNFSGPDCTGDRLHGILQENHLDEVISRRKLKQSRPRREPQSSDSSFNNLLSHEESKNRELASRLSWDFDKYRDTSEALRVIIPDSESPAKISNGANLARDRRAVSSTPLAHSTPHVSPRGPEELKLHATASWDADDPFGKVKGYNEMTKYASAEAMIAPESDTQLLFKLEDSSCASSCSEDNYSDVSNITISSQGSRKTKLVKKHSDKPASAKKNILSYLPNLPCTIQAESTPSGNSVEICQQHVTGTSENLSSEDSGCFTSIQSKEDSFKERQAVTKSVNYGEAVSKDDTNWWSAYNLNTDVEYTAKVDSEIVNIPEKPFNSPRDIRIQKPLTASIPLISAGKHGQEKLRRLSQTPQSPSKSPVQSPRDVAQTWDSGMNESPKAVDVNQANIDDQQEPLGRQLPELTKLDHMGYQQYIVVDEEDGKTASSSTECEQSVTPVVASDKTQDGQTVLKSPRDGGETSHSELCYEAVPQESGLMCPDIKELNTIFVPENSDGKMAQVEGAQLSSISDMDNGKYKPDSFPSHSFGFSCETDQIVNSYSGANSPAETLWSVDVLHASEVSLQTLSLTTQEVHLAKCENVADISVNEPTFEAQLGVLTCSDELDSAIESQLETSSAGLPALVSQVSVLSVENGASCVDLKSDPLVSETFVNEIDTVSELKPTTVDAIFTALDENACVNLLDKIHVNETQLHETSSSYNSAIAQEQFSVGPCSENAVFSDVSYSGLDKNKFYTVSIDYLSSFNCAAVIDSTAGQEVIKEAEHQELGLNTSTVHSGVTAENTDIESLPEPGIRDNRSPLERRDVTQMTARVTGISQTLEDSTENTDNTLHRNSWMSHLSTSSPISQHVLNESSQRADTTTVLDELSQNVKQGFVDRQITTKSYVSELMITNNQDDLNRPRQQDALDTSTVCTDIPRPVDESIIRQGNVAQRGGDLGFHKEEHFLTEKTSRFVDRGEEFIHTPGLHEVVAAASTGSRIVDTGNATIERLATNDQIVNRSSLVLSDCDDNSCADIVSSKSVASTLFEEDKDYATTTTNAPCSDAGKEDTVTVRTERSCLEFEINTTSRLPVYSLTITLSEPATGQGIRGRLHSVTSDQYPPTPELEATSRVTDQTATLNFHLPKAESDNADITTASTHQVFPITATKLCDTTNAEELLAPVDQTDAGDMPRSDHLDDLQAQLSLISNNIHSERLSASQREDQYRDHAEATSVLKQTVLWDTANLTHFPNTSCGNSESDRFQDSFSAGECSFVVTGELNKQIKSDVSELCAVSSLEGRECYDNDYDYVTTDSPKGTKLFPRPHPVKPGQLKTSSLWTLQEEAENAMSPRSSPKLARVSLASQGDSCSYQLAEPATSFLATMIKEKSLNVENERRQINQNVVYANIAPRLESSDVDDSDENYSSASTPDSDSKGSGNFRREQTQLNEAELVAATHNRDIDCQDSSKIVDMNYINTFLDPQEFDDVFTPDCVNRSHISVPNTVDSNNGKTSFEPNHEGKSYATELKSNLMFSVSSPQIKDDGLSPLDRLCTSLEQFTEPSNDGWRLILVAENATTASDSRESDMSISSAHMDNDSDDDTVSETSWKHSLGLNTSRSSLASVEGSQGSSIYTSTGRAEIKKTSSFDYDIPAYSTEANLDSNQERITAESRTDQIREEKIKQFENLLDEFSKSILPNAVISEFIFLREKRGDRSGSSASSTEDLYKSFTNEDTEKKQNHVCIVVEDENMNTFRFKRYLKKSHTKRKKGKKVLRFLSKLGCVTESLGSSVNSPSLRLKQPSEDAFSAESLTTSKRATSNPTLNSSSSFVHHNVLGASPLRYTDENNTPFSSNRSLDSIRSKADSAYSSISESVAGSMNSPAFQRGPSTSFRVPQASSGSVSSVFFSGSTSGEWSIPDGIFSTHVDDSNRDTSDSFGKYDFGYHSIDSPACGNGDMMTALSDVFDQLNVCEDEIDSALLNRARHGHVKAGIGKQ